MTADRKTLGRLGEDLAAKFLKRRGYKICDRNFSTRSAEIDIIALKNGAYCFVEVKTRKNSRKGSGKESVHYGKQQKIISGAMQYIKTRGLDDPRIRFHVAEVEFRDGGGPEINLIENAFRAA